MSISEKRSVGENTATNPKPYPEGYVAAEKEIRKLIEKLSIDQITPVAARMQVVADATVLPIEGKITESNLILIKRIARESRDRQYQKIMQAIIAAVQQGPAGIRAAHKTARRAVDIAFSWTYTYLTALGEYKDSLRQVRQEEKNDK